MDLQTILQYWSFIFLGVVVYSAGESFKRLFPKIAATNWYHKTVVFQAPLWATLIAALPWFPMPDSIGNAVGARILYGLGAGIASAWSYKAFMRLLGKDTKSQVSNGE